MAEHGNRYTLFNAPDTWTNPPSLLPIGYFISRMVAYKVSKTGTAEDYHDILKRFVVGLIGSDNFVKDVFDSVAGDAGLGDSEPLNMDGIAGFPGTLGEIGSLYGGLIGKLGEEATGHRLENRSARGHRRSIPRGSSGLFFHFRSDQNIVIFGHTHKADLRKSYILEAAPKVENIHLDLPCRSIYANCGTWVDSATYCTYVETQEDAAANRHYVRLRAYPNNTVLQEGFVEL